MRPEPSVPTWLAGKTGIMDTVPKPWTPVRVREDTLFCWGRDHAFDGRPFPSRIVSRGANLLARPVELRVKRNGQDLCWNACAVQSIERHPRGRFARRTSVGQAGDLLLTSEITLFYDGALRVDVRVEPLQPLTLDALTVSIPVRKAHASLIMAPLGAAPEMTTRAFTPDAIPAAGLTGPFESPGSGWARRHAGCSGSANRTKAGIPAPARWR